MRLSKRKFVVVTMAGLFGSVGALGLGVHWYRPVLRRFALSRRKRLPEPVTTGSLSDGEMATVIALAEVLVDERELSSDERECVRAHVQDRTENDPGYLTLYRMTAAKFDGLATAQFSTRSREERRAVATGSGLLDARVDNREWLYPFGKEARAIRGIAIPDLIEGYYRSAAGWAVVGYSVFPGRCGNLQRYTRPEVSPL